MYKKTAYNGKEVAENGNKNWVRGKKQTSEYDISIFSNFEREPIKLTKRQRINCAVRRKWK
jgi:hypothetical protein